MFSGDESDKTKAINLPKNSTAMSTEDWRDILFQMVCLLNDIPSVRANPHGFVSFSFVASPQLPPNFSTTIRSPTIMKYFTDRMEAMTGPDVVSLEYLKLRITRALVVFECKNVPVQSLPTAPMSPIQTTESHHVPDSSDF